MQNGTIETMITSLEAITNALKEELLLRKSETTEDTTSSKATAKKSTKKTVKTEEVAESAITREELEDMGYNELKAYAKSIGVKAVGNRDKIINLILDTVEGSSDEELEEEKPVKSAKTSKKSTKSVKKEEPEEPEEEQEEESVDDIEDLKAQLEDMEVEDLADILREAGLSARGKKPALINKILKAYEDGDITFEDEDSDEDDYDEDVESDDGEEYDVNDPENPDMTEERAEAIEELADEIRTLVKKKKLSLKDIEEELIRDFGYTKNEVKKIDDIVEEYINVRSTLISDEGIEVNLGEPYELNGVPACCGKPLEEDKDGGYVCSACGNVYEEE